MSQLPAAENLTPVSPPTGSPPNPTRITHGLARLVLASFLFTFIIARILVIFIMAGNLPPELFFHVKGTHVHHLNYGIFILSIIGGYLIFIRPTGKRLSVAATIYGIGLALTYDEFGMWLHLGGLYWQRASFDAVSVIAALLALIAYGSTIRHWRPRHRWTIALLIVAIGSFSFLLHRSVQRYGGDAAEKIESLEKNGPT